MSRITDRDRLEKLFPGGGDAVAALNFVPADTLRLIEAAIKKARQDGAATTRARKKQRKADAARNDWYREEIIARNQRFLAKQAQRAAAGDLDMLAGLAGIRRSIDTEIARAVAGCRDRGLSDEIIGAALGVTRMAVGQRYGRKGSFTGTRQS